MALIKCPECGKEISDKASACPNCGCPSSEWSKSNKSDDGGADVESERCLYCGSENIGEDGYCEECGMKHDSSYQQDHVITAKTTDKNILDESKAGKTFRCVRCGSRISEGIDVCPHCGYSYITQSQRSQVSSREQKANKNLLSVPKIILIIVVALICLEIIAQIIGEVSLVLFGILLFACTICFPASIIYLIVCIFLKKNKTPAYALIIGSVALFVVFMFMAFQFVPDVDTNSDENATQFETEEASEEILDIETFSEEPMSVSDVEVEKEEIIKESESYEAELAEESMKTPACVDVFVLDLIDNWSDYIGEYVRTTFEVGSCGDNYIQSTYEYNYIDVYPDNFKELEDGEYVTVTGYVTGETSSEFEIMDAHIEVYGTEAQAKYSEELSAYNERKAIEAAEYEADFKEEAVDVSYEELNRYPDTYKNKKIKVTIKVTDVEPDGIIFSGHYEAVINGTNNKVAVYDKREVKEPKLLDGDVAVIYGYGDGLTTVKVQDKSGLIPKTVDEYTIPGINIEFVEVQ